MDESVWTLAYFVALLLAVGALGGVLAGLLGVGGGIVIVPALFFVLTALDFPEATRMHVAVATSLATIILTSARSLQSHNKRGAVDWDILRGWGPFIVVGAVIGVVLAGYLETRMLLGVFGVVAFLVALQMLFGRTTDAEGRGLLGDAPPTGLVRAGWAGGNGLVSALMGIGGGTLGVTILTLYGRPIHQAVATSAGFGLLIAAPSVVGFIIAGWFVADKPPFTVGYVNLVAFAIIVPMTVLAAPVGARLAHGMNPKPLKFVFAFFLAVTALNMLREAGFG